MSTSQVSDRVEASPRRRAVKFVALGLIVVSLLGALWFARQAHAAHRQRQLWLAIYNAGGDARYEFTPLGWHISQRIPRWLVRVLGRDHFGLLVSADLRDSHVADDWLEDVPEQPQLRQLNLNRTELSDKGIQQLTKFPGLRGLGLSETKATDEGLANVAVFRNLERILLVGTQIGDEGVRRLTALEHLRVLDLERTR
ncbi:MAG: hypothetical protein IAF94_27260, partial [Pirellulaceae bacterium]|nr:hypothetical protein [Pirellulaceae bacterium]